jgi:hypothetical protein
VPSSEINVTRIYPKRAVSRPLPREDVSSEARARYRRNERYGQPLGAIATGIAAVVLLMWPLPNASASHEQIAATSSVASLR